MFNEQKEYTNFAFTFQQIGCKLLLTFPTFDLC